MEIICPDCKFSRTVPDDKVPSTAEMATCPKCGVRFRFRTVDAGTEATESAAAQTPGTPRDMTPQAPPSQTGPSEPPAGRAAPPPLPYEDAPSSPPREQGGDVFSGLEAMEGQQDEERRAGAGFQRRSEHHGYEEHGRYAEEDVPWERLDAYGFFPGLFLTIKRAMLQPQRFFASMPLGRGYMRPLVFYVLLSMLGAVVQFVFQALGLSMLTSMQGNEAEMVEAYQFMGMGAASAFMLLLYPIVFTVGLYVTVALHHLFLKLFQAASSGFEGTFRALAYGSAPTILSVVPLLGWVVASVWMLVVTIIGLKTIHRTSYARVLTAFCAMFFTFLLLIGFLAYFVHSLVTA